MNEYRFQTVDELLAEILDANLQPDTECGGLLVGEDFLAIR